MIVNTLQTDRLVLRQWNAEDLLPFSEMNCDPQVMEFFPRLLEREISDQLSKSLSEHIEKYGWGLWAASLKSTGEFIGFIGLQNVFHIPEIAPTVEIGWRLSTQHWGKGYATEGARAALQFGFQTLNLPEIVSFTTIPNIRSRHVMEKIGMHRNPHDDFDHPRVEEGHPLKRHVLYRLKKTDWEAQSAIASKNLSKFSTVRSLNLPKGHYAISGSGALGIRNLRHINDIDLIVSQELWDSLVKKYDVIIEDGIKRIALPGGLIEAFADFSFPNDVKGPLIPSVTERLAKAEIIEGLPFESLEHVLFFKQLMKREKDLIDIAMIDKLLKQSKR